MTPKKKLTSRQMHQAFHDTALPPVHEPLPQRWIDLLRDLDEREREKISQTKLQGRAR